MQRLILPLILIFLFACSSPQQQPERPNIILILADDLGVETIGTYGNQGYATPNLDQLARGGMRFEQCFSTPLCTPSRVQIMTGKYNFRNYVGFGILDPGEETFADHLATAGYKNLVIGKWQLLGNKHQRKLAGGKVGSLPEQAGFHDYCLWQIDALGSRYKTPTLSIRKEGGKAEKYEGYGPDIFVDYAIDFIEANKESPFFIYYPMVLTHDPFVPTPDDPDFSKDIKGGDPTYFGAMVEYMDKLVGRLVQKLEDEEIRENTLILFVGDNGTSRQVTSTQNGKEIKGEKGMTTHAGTHVPFIANWEGIITAGEVNKNLVDFTDFLPTLLDVAGMGADKVKSDGLSFYPQLMGEPHQSRDWVFCHYDPRWGKFQSKRYVHNSTWKLYENGELYNLVNDAAEAYPLEIEEQTQQVQNLITEFRGVLNTYK